MRTLLVLALLMVTSPMAAKDIYLPIAGSVGAFRTDSRIFNPSSKDIVINATFLPLGRDNTAAASQQITVRRRQMAVYDDVVGSLFGASGLGAIRLSSSDEFMATSRIYAGVANGTLGQFTPGLDPSSARSRGVILQLRSTGPTGQAGTFRTNLGFVNPNPTASTIIIRSHDRQDRVVGEPLVQTIEPFGALFPVTLDPAAGDFTDGWVTYEASQPLFAYGSVVDNGTTDPTFIPAFEDPGARDATILFDAGHLNFHTIGTTYAPFAQLLRNDGWVVESLEGRFERQPLQRARVLVIVNAISPVNADVNNWTLPTPSAFAADEIEAVRDWVEEGGSLMLIADHMPFAGAASDLAAAFGIRFSNGFAFDSRQLTLPRTCLTEEEVHVFRKSDGSLREHAVTIGIDFVGTFTGSAFETPSTAVPLMVFGPDAVSLTPQTAWEFPSSTPRINISGSQQGALLQHGLGRVAVFGEAAMFTEQTCGPGRAMGMTSPSAAQNGRFLLNVMQWLGGGL